MGIVDWVNKRNQDILIYRSARAGDWIDESEAGESFAVFGGSICQRSMVVERGIARCIGKMGVIVLHNNEQLENDLYGFREIYPLLFEENPNLMSCFINSTNLNYEPLYGMDENCAAEAVYPVLSKESPMYMQQHICSEALKNYLYILRHTGRKIHLDHLWKLCNMDLDELEKTELSKLRQDTADSILAVLSQDNIYRQVRADVNHFAGQLDGRLWRKDTPETSVSLIQAARHHALISMKLSSNNLAVLDYLGTELNYLIDNNACFLLVVDSVNVDNSIIGTVVTNPSMRFSSILAGNSMNELGVRNLDKPAKIILFQCANAAVARQYSDLIGTYLRQFISVSNSKSRGSFEFFGNYGKSRSISEQEYVRIRPEELVRLGGGAVLIDQVSGTVEWARRFIC